MKIQTFLVLSTICAVTSGRRSAPVEKARPAPADHIHNGRHFGTFVLMYVHACL